MNRYGYAWLCCVLMMGNLCAQFDSMPAARMHVRIENGHPVKFTSKLAQVVELNFTYNEGHLSGKQVISESLERISRNYARDGKSAFTVRKFMSPNSGAEPGASVQFTLEDLLAGEVIVANNIGNFNELITTQPAQAAAIEKAVGEEGRGMLGFHGSGDGGGGWPFYSEDLYPMKFQGQGPRIPLKVYKDQAREKHVILQHILETETDMATVPVGVDDRGRETFVQGVATRSITTQAFRFKIDPTTDPKYASRVTSLLKYDPLESSLENEYRFKGGNSYAFLNKVGQGFASFFLGGHASDELIGPGATFDGESGDFDRYVAQNLFFLAGYDKEPCSRTACEGLPIVDADAGMTGRTYRAPTAVFNPARPGFTSPSGEQYTARLVDLGGRIVASRTGFDAAGHEFDLSSLSPGIYFLNVKIGSAPAQVRRYASTQASR